MSKKSNKSPNEPVEGLVGDTSANADEKAAENTVEPPQPANDTEIVSEAADYSAESDGNSFDAQLKAEKDKYLRLLAEYDNFRKRSQKEREAIYADVRADTILRFLPVYDNLARALSQETADEAYRKGVEMTMNQLKEVMAKLGLAEIESVGKTFDPALHTALMHIEDDAYGENEIVTEFEKGFKLGDKVIRFSMVEVAN